jgi:hypothetical protein
MKTAMLRTIQRPSHIDGLLRSLVKYSGAVPVDAEPIASRSELPFVVQRIIIQATKAGLSWSCWRDDAGHVWLFTAEMSLSLSRERGAPVLQVTQYAEDGLRNTGSWVADIEGNWCRCVD